MISLLLLAGSLAAPASGPRNHLAGELSPYLLQQAAEPVDWFPWGPEAFDRARREGRPVVLSIGYSSCHPCQRMDRNVFRDPRVVQTLNTRFVSVKVDREERPEIEELYAALGAVGGPVSVLLGADGRALGEAFRAARGDAVEGFLAWIKAAITAPPQRRETPGPAGAPAPDAPQSTPPHGALRLLLAEHVRTGDREALQTAATLLEAMARGGLRDHLGGGFHHAGTNGTWMVSSFEKLLADNALLIRTYAQGYAASRNLLFRDVVKETVAWAVREMRGSTGTFWTSVDSTTEGQDGRFYLWSREELLATLGKERGEEYLSVYRVEAPGVLTLTGSPFAGLGSSREVLAVRRGRRVRPAVDEKVVTGPNGLMIGALATSGSLLKRGGDVELARRAASAVLERLGPAPTLRHCALGPRTGGAAILEDYAFFAEGLLDLHEATGEVRWRDEARALADVAVSRFWDVAAGGFYSTDSQHGPVPLRVKSATDRELPSANGVLASVMLRLGRSTGEERYTRLGQRTLEAFAAELLREPRGRETLAAAAGLLAPSPGRPPAATAPPSP